MGNDLYIWGWSDDAILKGITTKPKKFESVPNGQIISVGLGASFIGILCESKEESKENEIVLKSGQEITLQTKKRHNVYVQNQALFGDNEWIQIKSKTFRPLHPYFGGKFVENLVLNKDKTMIELIEHSEIEKNHHLDIIGAEYFVPFNALNKTMIEGGDNQEKILENGQKYSFDKIEEIAFKIPSKQKYVQIYVKPKSTNSIFLLKQIKL